MAKMPHRNKTRFQPTAQKIARFCPLTAILPRPPAQKQTCHQKPEARPGTVKHTFSGFLKGICV
jgi:hypothetical protein